MSGRRRVSDPEVIDLATSSDDDDVVEVEEGWTAVAGGGGGGGGHAARQDEDDAAMALRLQEEEYRGGPVAPPARAAAAAAAQAEPVTELDWSRKYRQDQDAEYEASLAVRWARLARPRVLTSALCTLCRPIVLARRKRVLPRPQLPPRLLLRREQPQQSRRRLRPPRLPRATLRPPRRTPRRDGLRRPSLLPARPASSQSRCASLTVRCVLRAWLVAKLRRTRARRHAGDAAF
jgi:hypothetical protein